MAKLLKGRITPGSGSKSQKGDVKASEFLAECKYRKGPSPDGCCFPLEVEWLETIWNHAMVNRRIPVLAIEWGNGHRAVILPVRDYEKLDGQSCLPVQSVLFRTETICWGPLGLPTCLSFEKIEIPETHWVITSWEDMRELRRAVEEPEEEPKKARKWPIRSKGLKRWSKR